MVVPAVLVVAVVVPTAAGALLVLFGPLAPGLQVSLSSLVAVECLACPLALGWNECVRGSALCGFRLGEEEACDICVLAASLSFAFIHNFLTRHYSTMVHWVKIYYLWNYLRLGNPENVGVGF